MDSLFPTDNDNQGSSQSFPIADLVSLESVVNILIRKGICTPEELYQEEQLRRQEGKQQKKNQQSVTVPGTNPPLQNGVHHKGHNSNWLKRKMSKKRWARKLGSFFFGWEWKKHKVNVETEV